MAYERFDANNAAVLLIDHQVGTMSWVKSIAFDEMKGNALLLAKLASICKLPVVLTSSMEEHAQGPLLAELAEILPDAFRARIKRHGVVNAMDDENFAAAVRATQRSKFILAGVTNDICTVYPALSLVGEGVAVQVVADAGGSPTRMSDDIALRRMEQAGVTLTSTNQLVAEVVGNWTTPEGGQLAQLMIARVEAEVARSG